MHKLTSLNFKYGEKFMYTVYYLHHYRTIPFFKKKKKKVRSSLVRWSNGFCKHFCFFWGLLQIW